MTTRATPNHKQPERLQTIKEVMAQDELRAKQARIYYDWCEAKKLFQETQHIFSDLVK